MEAVRSKPHWLNRSRLTVYPRMLLVFFVAVVSLALASNKGSDLKALPYRADFVTFWSASRLALAGHAADAYSIPLIAQAERAYTPLAQGSFAWFYPPAFYLLILPTGLLPYNVAFALFMLASLGCYLSVFRGIFADRRDFLVGLGCLAIFPGLWICLLDGQNGFLTAALAAGAIRLLPRRPTLAGVCIGMLAIKPHLALLFPVMLIATRAWRALLTSAFTALGLTALGTAVLGVTTLKAFLATLPEAGSLLASGGLPWKLMPTLFAQLRILGAPVRLAYAAHFAVAVAAAVAVWYVGRRSSDWQLRGAALMSATFLVSPYVFHYDLVWLAFPIAWLTLLGIRDGFVLAERDLLIVAWLLPVLMIPLVLYYRFQLGPWVLAALLLTCVRRARLKQPVALTSLSNSQPLIPAYAS